MTQSLFAEMCLEGKMRRNKLSVILSLITILFFFTTAATCNFCGIALDTGSSEESTSKTKTEGTEKTKETEGKDEAEPEQQNQGTNSQQANNSAPVIEKIEIAGMDVEIAKSEGYFDELPMAEAEGAEMTITVHASDKNGDEIHYRSFDSMGADFEITLIDNNNAEITWVVPVVEGIYTLTIEASDEKGGVGSYSIDMNFIMSAEPADSEELNETSLETVYNETGYISDGGLHPTVGAVYVGDGNDPDKYYNAYLSFDISSLTGKEVVSSSLIMNLQSEHGNRSYLGNLRVGTLDYGVGTLSGADADIPAEMIVQFPNSTTDINYSGDSLREKLQEKINAEGIRFQLKIYWSHPSSNLDDISDSLLYNLDTIHLFVQYIE